MLSLIYKQEYLLENQWFTLALSSPLITLKQNFWNLFDWLIYLLSVKYSATYESLRTQSDEKKYEALQLQKGIS